MEISGFRIYIITFVMYRKISLQLHKNVPILFMKIGTFFFSSLSCVCDFLQTGSYEQTNKKSLFWKCVNCVYDYKYVVKHSMKSKQYKLRVWQTVSLFNFFYIIFSNSNVICALDYEISHENEAKNSYRSEKYINVTNFFVNTNININENENPLWQQKNIYMNIETNNEDMQQKTCNYTIDQIDMRRAINIFLINISIMNNNIDIIFAKDCFQ